MTLETFFTTQLQQTPQGKSIGTGVTATPGGITSTATFIDLILSRLAETSEQQAAGQKAKEKAEENQPLDSDNPALDKVPTLNIAELLANTEDIAEQIKQDGEALGLDLNTQIAQALILNELESLKQAQIDGQLVAGQKGTPEIKEILESFLLKLEDKKGPSFAPIEKILTAIENNLAKENPEAITTNITPEQLTALQNLSAEELEKAFEETPVAALFVAFVQITQPQKPTDIPGLQRSLVVSERPLNVVQSKQTPTTSPANDSGARLNSLLTSATGQTPATSDFNPEDFGSTESFKDLIKQMKAGEQAQTATTPNAAQTKAVSDVAPQLSSAIQNTNTKLSDNLLASFSWDEHLAETYGTGHNTNSVSALTSHVTQTQSAGHAHPATQLIAINMQQQTARGENRTMTLQLDPPELGKVEVRMEFAKDKTMKAHMVVEKPETFTMLQRDAHILERTIQELGLDSDSGISFELAQDDHNFGHDGGHDGHQGGGSGNGAEEDLEIIETTMTWHVDAETGHMRYNILA